MASSNTSRVQHVLLPGQVGSGKSKGQPYGETQAMAQLLALFPEADPGFILYILQSSHFNSSGFELSQVIELVSHKLFEVYRGMYPTVILRRDREGRRKQVVKARDREKVEGIFGGSSMLWKGKGKGREREQKIMSLEYEIDEVLTKNRDLMHLNEMFPNIDVPYLRQLLVSAPHSFLFEAVRTLIENDPGHGDVEIPSTSTSLKVEHRSRAKRKHRSSSLGSTSTSAAPVSPSSFPARPEAGLLLPVDLFRTASYISSTRALLQQQFPSINESSIKAIMAEHNNDYLASRLATKAELERRKQSTGIFDQVSKVVGRLWRGFSAAAAAPPVENDTEGKGNGLTLPSKRRIANHMKGKGQEIARRGDGGLELTFEDLDEELQREIWELERPEREKEVQADEDLARDINRQYASERQELIECLCCFDDVAFEDTVTCGLGNHTFCRNCLTRQVNEAIYGQGILKLDDLSISDTGGGGMGITCFTIDSCPAPFSHRELQRGLPKETFRALERRVATQVLNSLILGDRRGTGDSRLVTCPFCPYAEIGQGNVLGNVHYSPGSSFAMWIFSRCVIRILHLTFLVTLTILPFLYASVNPRSIQEFDDEVGKSLSVNRLAIKDDSRKELSTPVMPLLQPFTASRLISAHLEAVARRLLMQKNGAVFKCKNTAQVSLPSLREGPSETKQDPGQQVAAQVDSLKHRYSHAYSTSPDSLSRLYCGRVSCLLCNREFFPGHSCLSDEQDGLRLAVERAMSDAVKRTCPNCGLGFTKSDGCNSMQCICGYKMCYICRKGLKAEGYEHFCRHFRMNPGPCTECNKCDLYRADDDDGAARIAAQLAKETWIRDHPGSGIKILVNEKLPGHEFNVFASVRRALDAITESSLRFILRGSD